MELAEQMGKMVEHHESKSTQPRSDDLLKHLVDQKAQHFGGYGKCDDLKCKVRLGLQISER